MFAGLLVWLGLFLFGLYILYMVIKISVKHAINESWYTIEGIIENAIKRSRIQCDENKEDV